MRLGATVAVALAVAVELTGKNNHSSDPVRRRYYRNIPPRPWRGNGGGGVLQPCLFQERCKMAKGSKVSVVRIPDDLRKRIELQILSRNVHSREEGWVWSDFVRVACEEKLAKMARSRRRSKKQSPGISSPSLSA